MNTPKTVVEYELSEFLAGRRDNAFHGLIEAGPDIIPELINLYEDTEDIGIRVFLIQVISEFRLPVSLNFLKHALRQENPKIWKSALNGLAMVGSEQAIEALDHVLASVSDEEKRAWIEEAMADLNPMKRADSKIVSLGDIPANRRIQMFGDIDDACANEVIAKLLFHHMKSQTDPIVLEIDSPGGSLTSTFAILETMRYVPCPIRTVCYGQAYGCAALLLAAGTPGQRMVGPEAQLGFCKMVIKEDSENQPPGQVFVDQLTERLLQELASACNQPKQRIADDLDSERSFTCDEALCYGLVDGAVAGRLSLIENVLPDSLKKSPGLTVPLEDIVATIVIILVLAGIVTLMLFILK